MLVESKYVVDQRKRIVGLQVVLLCVRQATRRARSKILPSLLLKSGVLDCVLSYVGTASRENL
jgi:hypothetical protein